MAEKAQFTGVNEHFEAIFNAAEATQIVFQQPASPREADSGALEHKFRRQTSALPESAESVQGFTTDQCAHLGGIEVVVSVAELAIDIDTAPLRSEEHTSELQSRGHLVCRLLLEKKKQRIRSEPPKHDVQRTAH